MKRANKALSGVVGLIIACMLFVFIPPKSNEAQPVSAQTIYIPEPNTFDSIAYYKHEKMVQDSINLVEAKRLAALTIRLNNVVKAREPSNPKPNVVIRYGGEIYDVKAQAYKSYLIVDVDSFLEKVNPDLQDPYAPIIEVPERNYPIKESRRKSLWRKIFPKKGD